ncbi:MAG: bis(5'-nucleosyl)-tetraphosphatase (symmetrical) YqeK [Anaerolineae bacterium]|jgi:predicted HD superfamily hydrolase involved in NAD metabolism
MRDYFLTLASRDAPALVLERFYRAAGLLDTLDHVERVAAEACRLAERLGLDEEAANLAGLAHDLGGVVPVEERVAVAEGMGLAVSEADRAMPLVLHGPIAAEAAAWKLGVDDDEVLNAIRYHTTLRRGAGLLEKVIFVADKMAYDPTSPHRGEYLPAMQEASSLDGAALAYLDFLLDNTWRYGWYLHPRAVAAYRELLDRTRR